VNQKSWVRLFDYRQAFHQPAVTMACIALGVALAVAPLIFLALERTGKISPQRSRELWARYLSWLVIVPILLAPALLGAFWTILGTGLLSLLCYREFSRATGLFREKLISITVVVGTLAITAATLDHWYRLFVAISPLCICFILAVAVIADRPQGYIQRVALGILGFSMFGCGFGHLGFLANDSRYRAWIIFTLLATELNDVFAYVSGRLFGRKKLAPLTSPNKTEAGGLGALCLTTLLTVTVGPIFFVGTVLTQWHHLVILGLVISAAGQLGDLMFSSIKRDLGIKDLGTTIPGHGGLLDRFDSLVPVAPAVFHYINYFVGVGVDEPVRIFSGAN
jgi:phosphatidate cytidylyltransferase